MGAAIRLFLRKKVIPGCAFVFGDGDGVEDGREATDCLRGSFDSNFPISKNVCHASTMLIFIGGVEMSKMPNIAWFIGLSSTRIGHRFASNSGAGLSMIMVLKGSVSKFKSLRLGGIMMGCCLP